MCLSIFFIAHKESPQSRYSYRDLFLAPLLPGRTKGRFFIPPKTDVSLLLKFCSLLLCLWNGCMQPLHHPGGKQGSCCLAAPPIYQLPGHLSTPKSVLLGWMFPGELHCSVCKAVWSETHEWLKSNKTNIHFLLNILSFWHRGHNLPLVCSILG